MTRKLDANRLSNYMIMTILIMVVSAWVGAMIGAILTTTPMIMASMLLGPLGVLAALPLALAQAALAYGGTVIVPIWALVGGGFFSSVAARNAATSGSIPSFQLFAESHPIYQKVNQLAQELNLPPIKWVGWFEDDSINAFAMGHKQSEAVIGFSRGAVTQLDSSELDAVMAHELAHVANHDMSRMTYGHGVQNALTWFLIWRGLKRLARWIFTPIAELELMRFSRKREFYADAIGAALTSPSVMIGALKKIENDRTLQPRQLKHLSQFMFRSNAHTAFDTHPKIEDRISAIQSGKYVDKLPFLATDKAIETPQPMTPSHSDAH